MAPNTAALSNDLKNNIDVGLGQVESPASRVISRKELASHSTRESCWVSINGRVYDVTGFEHEHPGGEIILTAAGQDATDVFSAFHSASNYKLLPRFLIGILEDSDTTSSTDKYHSPEYIADIRKMRADLTRLKAFDSSKLFYAYKVGTNVSIAALAFFVTLRANSIVQVWLGAALLALFFQQCGWLAHDFLHHQVFKNRVYNNLMGLIVGNVFQGFSVSWWKMKHNHHHAAPNVTETAAGGDPDIHTYPVLLWSEKIIEGSSDEISTLPKFLVNNQSIFYFPILCMARVSWLIQSILFQTEPAWNFVGGNKWRAVELVMLAVHHITYVWLVAQLKSWSHVISFVILSQGLGGLLIGVVFTVGHNAREVLTDQEMRDVDFVRLQVKTTRDIDPSAFNQWFSGGLSHQIEHHIWPTIPRHNLPKAREILMEFCKKHEIEYLSQGLVEGNMEVWRMLARIGKTV